MFWFSRLFHLTRSFQFLAVLPRPSAINVSPVLTPVVGRACRTLSGAGQKGGLVAVSGETEAPALRQPQAPSRPGQGSSTGKRGAAGLCSRPSKASLRVGIKKPGNNSIQSNMRFSRFIGLMGNPVPALEGRSSRPHSVLLRSPARFRSTTLPALPLAAGLAHGEHARPGHPPPSCSSNFGSARHRHQRRQMMMF